MTAFLSKHFISFEHPNCGPWLQLWSQLYSFWEISTIAIASVTFIHNFLQLSWRNHDNQGFKLPSRW